MQSFERARIGGTATSVTANLPGDSLFAPAVSPSIHPALALSPTTVELVGLPPTATGAVNLVAGVAGSSCLGLPSGTVEFVDGSASPGPSAIATLPQVSRPAGLHSLQVKSSGDRHYSPGTSAVVPVIFQ